MLLDANKILKAIYFARQQYRKGELKDTIKNAVPISFWETSEKSSDIKKQNLIEMARKGNPRPNSRTHPLGNVLNIYIKKGYSGYDPIFTKKIHKIAQHWFVDQAEINKQKLLEMGERGEPRPNSQKNPLGQALQGYLRKNVNWYDSVFNKKIRKVAPHWFISRSDSAIIKKNKLLEMARRGEPRPNSRKHPLGCVLSMYIREDFSGYDPIFTKKICKLAPHWFKK